MAAYLDWFSAGWRGDMMAASWADHLVARWVGLKDDAKARTLDDPWADGSVDCTAGWTAEYWVEPMVDD